MDYNLFNLDETFWRLINGNIDVIGMKESENRKVITGLAGKERGLILFLLVQVFINQH